MAGQRGINRNLDKRKTLVSLDFHGPFRRLLFSFQPCTNRCIEWWETVGVEKPTKAWMCEVERLTGVDDVIVRITKVVVEDTDRSSRF